MCAHDGTATGVLTGARNGLITPLVVCEACDTVLAVLPSEPYRLEPVLGHTPPAGA